MMEPGVPSWPGSLHFGKDPDWFFSGLRSEGETPVERFLFICCDLPECVSSLMCGLISLIALLLLNWSLVGNPCGCF